MAPREGTGMQATMADFAASERSLTGAGVQAFRGRMRRANRIMAGALVAFVVFVTLTMSPVLGQVGHVGDFLSEPFKTGGTASPSAMMFTSLGPNPYLASDSWTPHGAINVTACNRADVSVNYVLLTNVTFPGLDVSAVDIRLFGWGFVEGSYVEAPIALNWVWYVVGTDSLIQLTTAAITQGAFSCVGFSFDLYAVFTSGWQGGSYWFELAAQSA